MRDSNRTITPSARSRAPDNWADDPHHWNVRGKPASSLSVAEIEKVFFKEPARTAAWAAYVHRRKRADQMLGGADHSYEKSMVGSPREGHGGSSASAG